MLVRTLITSSAILFFQLAHADVHKAQTAIETFSQLPGLKSASISFLAVDAKHKTVMASYDADRTLTPASTTKLWSTAAAFEILGTDYRGKTEVSYTGKINDNGVLEGDVVITGYGDPTLGSSHFKTRENMRDFLTEWVSFFKANNIKTIIGDIYADASVFGYFGVPEGWTWNDMGNYYGAFPSGLTLFDNILELFFTTSSKENGETWIKKTNPIISSLRINNFVKSDAISSDNAYVFAAPYTNDAFVTGTLPLNQVDFIVKAAIQNPEDLIAQELLDALRLSGIEVQGSSYGVKVLQDTKNETKLDNLKKKRTLLFSHKGEKLGDIAKIINMKSHNLFAEHLIHWFALEKDGNNAYHKRGMQIMNDYWKSKLNVESARITDGSGLSRSNNISAQHFVDLLYFMKDNSNFENTLPISGESGTLRNLCSGQPCSGKIKAKSGAINGVKSYAGYAYNSKGEKIIFAFIVNNHSGQSSHLKNQMEVILNALIL